MIAEYTAIMTFGLESGAPTRTRAPLWHTVHTVVSLIRFVQSESSCQFYTENTKALSNFSPKYKTERNDFNGAIASTQCTEKRQQYMTLHGDREQFWRIVCETQFQVNRVQKRTENQLREINESEKENKDRKECE